VWHPLGRNLPAALQEYGRRVQGAEAREHELDALVDGALMRMKKRRSAPLSASTIDAYERAAAKLKHLLRKFAHPAQVKQKDAAMVKVLLADTPVMANRVLTFGRLVWADFLEHQLVEENPFVGVKRNRTRPRTRNYTWEEWNAIRTAARPLMQLVMDGLFLTDQRIGDLLKIEERDLLEQGIYVKQQKTGKELIIGWNEDLREWVKACRALRGTVVAVAFDDPRRPRPLLRSKRGRPLPYDTVGNWWREACGAAGVEDGHLHDGRAFSATEAKRQGLDPQKLLGHDEPRTAKIYLRGREIEVVAGPRMSRSA
jgi:integrase